MDKDIEQVIDTYIAAWDSMDFNRLQSLWNSAEDQIYYLAEEIDRPFYDLSEVIKYWQHTESAIKWLAVSASEKRCKPLAHDLCVVSYQMHVDASMTGSKAMGFQPIGVDVRVSAILRKTNEGWRFIHYAEAPLGALPFVRRAYNQNVQTDKT